MREREARKILDALDMLGLALANHNHQWTAEERAAYQNARLAISKHIPSLWAWNIRRPHKSADTGE